MAKKFLKTDLVRSLEQHVGAPVGMEGLETLIYGWRKKLRLTSHAIDVRDWPAKIRYRWASTPVMP